MLKLEGLGRRFGGNVAVDAATFGVPSGQMVGLIGPSGAGKSTLLRLVARLIDPTGGRILVDDVDVAQLKGRELREWRAECATICSQGDLAGTLTVATTVLMGLVSGMPQWRSKAQIFTPRERALALSALERVGMAHAAHHRVAALSQAGQRRVALARALAQRPRLLLADDPVSGLDAAQAKGVMDSLRKLNRGTGLTVICSLQDPAVARAFCDRIIGMRDGRIVFDGAPEVLDHAALGEIHGACADGLQSAMDLVSAA